MEYETEEQQVEALKAWWAENGRAVIAGVVLGATAIGGWTLWQDRKETLAVDASDAFSRTIEAVSTNDTSTAVQLADELQEEQPKNLYSSYANLAAARVDVENDNLASAAARLKWVAANAPLDSVQLIAKVRLARVQGALGDISAGLSTLPATYPVAFAGLVEEVRGDLLVIDGKLDAARSAYQSAQDSQFVANRDTLTMKLNELALPADESSSTESAS